MLSPGELLLASGVDDAEFCTEITVLSSLRQSSCGPCKEDQTHWESLSMSVNNSRIVYRKQTAFSQPAQFDIE